jgi:ribonucleoside-diphosphate reductase alpha chain
MRKFSKEEVYESTLKYFSGDNFLTDIWIDKYCLKNLQGEYMELSPDDMHHRLAKEFARIEQKYPNPLSEEEIYNLFKDFKYIVPQGRVNAGLGNYNSYRSLSNCLVLPSPFDSYSSIMYTDTMLVNSAKRGCGYGIDLSNIRPINDSTTNAANTSTGIIPFMERYSNSTREVGQESRRGACLLGINISHPQSLDFAKAKRDKTKITGANISLKIDNKFFEAIQNNETYDLIFNNKIYKTIKAKEYWNEIINNVKLDSEPGIFMWDKMFEYDSVSVYKDHLITLTNACGEQPMGVFDSCRLIVLNLYSFIDNPFTDKAVLNKEKLYKLAYIQLRLADDLVDLEIEYIDRILNKIYSDPEPIEQKQIEIDLWKNIKEIALKGRRCGCGLTALGDMLAAMNLQYGSEESLSFVQEVMYIKMKAELNASIDLSISRGSFLSYNKELEYNPEPQNSFYKFLLEEFPEEVERMKVYGRRNINWSTIAPTGTTSLMTQTTSGCEPCFSIYHKRKRKITSEEKYDFIDQNGDKWKEYIILHPKFKEWYNNSECRGENGAYCNSIQWNREGLEKVTKLSPYYKSTAYEVDPIQRVKLQALLQKYTTSAISSTINLPKTISNEEISNIYLTAWKLGCKGITCYIEDSRTGVLVSVDKKEEEFKQHDAPKRPTVLSAEIYIVKSKGKEWLVVVGIYKFPYEIFAVENKWNIRNTYNVGEVIKRKKGIYDLLIKDDLLIENFLEEISDEENNLTRMISTSLRHGANIKFIVEQLNKSRGDITSFAKVISRILKKYIKDKEYSNELCPECNSKLIYEGGCKTCKNCGWNKC